MGKFFHGWRRKAGTAALAIAMLMIGCWGRSQISNDRIFIPIGSGRVYRLMLRPDGIGYTVYDKASHLNQRQMFYVDNGVIPWSVTLPLAIFAAWFLFYKPRQVAVPENSPSTSRAN